MKRWRVGDVQRLGAGGGAGETWSYGRKLVTA